MTAASAAVVNNWHHVRRLLAVRVDNMGDVLMTTPALAAIRQTLPDAHVALLASPSGAALASHLPMVDEVIAAQVPWVQGPPHRSLPPSEDAVLVSRIAAADFDAAVIFTTVTQSALPAAMLCCMAAIPLRLAHCRENPYALLTDWIAEADVLGPGMRHEVSRQLALVQAVGMHTGDDRLVFALCAPDVASIDALLDQLGIADGRPLVVVHPGATAASRRYPAARFGEAAAQIARSVDCHVVFTGDASESALIDEARRAMGAPSHALAGRLTIGQLAALIDRAAVVVSNNTGPAHIAAARSTPVVDLYALTNPQHTPWRVPSRVLSHDVPCRNCLKSICPQGHHRCLLGIESPAVAQAALSLLREASAMDAPARPLQHVASQIA